MRTLTLLSATCIAAFTLPAFADSMSMMKGGEVMAVTPDGHTGTMMLTDKMMGDNMMKMAKPLDHCVMMMTGADGKMFMVDTSTPDAMAQCEKMAK